MPSWKTGRAAARRRPRAREDSTIAHRDPSKRLALTLHIGTGKTGTTSLQSFLRQNRPRLADAGWLYPRSPGRTPPRAVRALDPARRRARHRVQGPPARHPQVRQRRAAAPRGSAPAVRRGRPRRAVPGADVRRGALRLLGAVAGAAAEVHRRARLERPAGVLPAPPGRPPGQPLPAGGQGRRDPHPRPADRRDGPVGDVRLPHAADDVAALRRARRAGAAPLRARAVPQRLALRRLRRRRRARHPDRRPAAAQPQREPRRRVGGVPAAAQPLPRGARRRRGPPGEPRPGPRPRRPRLRPDADAARRRARPLHGAVGGVQRPRRPRAARRVRRPALQRPAQGRGHTTEQRLDPSRLDHFLECPRPAPRPDRGAAARHRRARGRPPGG